jgi:hypothetical protein
MGALEFGALHEDFDCVLWKRRDQPTRKNASGCCTPSWATTNPGVSAEREEKFAISRALGRAIRRSFVRLWLKVVYSDSLEASRVRWLESGELVC